ncbi:MULTISPECIES: ribosome biogenesis GTPase YqeH [unclassified Paenibacillus]|uniref:ribosome biogenesis GTPase YqeH n=1 Tax=unclassified Paenibacillus TaxID=185978 RepID=UPI001AEA11F8|nr:MULTISPECIES: ribosome biogenesis GTPase YqeH [unclassified Paenibacillus]MBP1156389.1 ribosome biogenesis GTPase YqeH [Paenibacillus sp. PvP091]MBP1168225.1 ribosome biogenesis GTPase YqeH [Paenibacillus sp. PvR098]MBP2439253.1 ribosome biogenesis GTPase YqeH [Paenibacillus sp. PvP052]
MTDQKQTTTEATHCAGCGVALQTEDAERLGYVPEQALTKTPVICQRCFRIKNYNEASSITLNQDDFLRLLTHVGSTQSLVVNIVDLFDFEGSMISGLPRFVGNNPIVLVVNKIDLLPKVTNYNRILNWVQRQAKEAGLKVAEVVLCSAKKNMGFERVIEALDEHRRGRDIYVVGATNVGKSTLINRLIRDYSDLDAELTTSQYPGTTLDLVRIPLEDGASIIDTPGIVYHHRLTELVSKKDLMKLMPDKPVKPLVFQLNERQTIFFGGFTRFDFVQGERQSFTFYMSNALQAHRTKLERADELYEEHKGELLSPPTREELDKLPKLAKHPVRIPKGSNLDVSISGIGWVKVNGTTGADLVIHVPKGVKVAVRESLI